MTVAIGSGGGACFPNRDTKGRFEDLSSSSEIKNYLKNVLKYSGNTSKDNKTLSHYSNIECILNIVTGGYLWLGSMSKMNDNLEYEVVRDLPYKLFFTSFSKMTENIAMYRIYSQAPDGTVLELTYKEAEEIINCIPKDSSGKSILHIVRDKKVIEQTVTADVYWAAVCYQELHSNKIKTGSVTNSRISNPMLSDELAGFIKLDGWEFEKEVRLCAVTDGVIEETDRLAIKLPKDLAARISIIKCPNFDKDKYTSEIRTLKKHGVRIQESEYEDIISFDKQQRVSGTASLRTERFDSVVEKAEIILTGDTLDSYGEIDSEIGLFYLSIPNYLERNGIKYTKVDGIDDEDHLCLVVKGLKFEYIKSLSIKGGNGSDYASSALRISIAIHDFINSLSLLIEILRLYKIEMNRIRLQLKMSYGYIVPTEEAVSVISDHDEFDLDSNHLDTYFYNEYGIKFNVKKDDSRKRRTAGIGGGIITIEFNNRCVNSESIVNLIDRLLEIGFIYKIDQ